MRINSIEIEGLWSYREPQRLDITGHALIVGMGENGAGKSTLLVGSLLVAFYGKFPTKTIEESITDGAAQGRVSVDFEVNGANYRVGRTYPRAGKATGQILVEDTSAKSGWRALTEAGIKEVNTYLIELLGMDYETATMTWIAEQGQYGKFAAAQPADRFKLLSSVFGLDEYTPRAQGANSRFRAADAEVTRLDGRIDELTGALDSDEAAETGEGLTALTDDEPAQQAATVQAEIDQVGQAIAELNANDPARKTVEARQALEIVRSGRMKITSPYNEGSLLEQVEDTEFYDGGLALASRSRPRSRFTPSLLANLAPP